MTSISLPAERFEQEDNSVSILTERTSRHLMPVIRGANIEVRNNSVTCTYSHGLLNSFSVYAHSRGLKFSAQKTLCQLFEEIDRYTFEADEGVDLEEFALFTDDVHLADTQVWTTRTYTLAEVPDSSLPHFPEEDFED
jgi:hypothetical protein